MIGKTPNYNDGELFRTILKDFIDMNHELTLLADRIDWRYFEKAFASSTPIPAVWLFGKMAEESLVVSDTIVQGNNTTFPTDVRLCKKVIDGCSRIVHTENLSQRQTYTKISRELLRTTYNSEHPKRHRKAVAAMRNLRTIAGRQMRELERVMTKELRKTYEEEISVYNRVLSQTPHSKDKVYSIHKPQTASGNRKLPEPPAYDRGGRGVKAVVGVRVITQGKPNKSDTAYDRKKKRYPFRRRAGFEPVFGHLKKDYHMQDNFLSGRESASINAMLAATGWNLKKTMKYLAKKNAKTLFVLLQILFKGPQYKLQTA